MIHLTGGKKGHIEIIISIRHLTYKITTYKQKVKLIKTSPIII